MAVHPAAIVHPSTRVPSDAEVGPYALIDEDVDLGPGVRIGPFCHVHAGSRLAAGASLAEGVVVGGRPQDLKYRGEKTGVSIGRGTQLREYVTVNRGTSASGTTSIGADCLLMAYTHVGHDCEIGDRVVIANAVHLGGHVLVGEGAVISGITGIHQFGSIGAGAFLGGGLRAIKDVLPFTKGLGDPMRYGGLNPMGLERLGFPPSALATLRTAYKELFRAGKPALADWLSRAGEEARKRGDSEGQRLITLLEAWLSRQTRPILMRAAEGGEDGVAETGGAGE